MEKGLYRGQRVDNGEWVEGYYSPFGSNSIYRSYYIHTDAGEIFEVIPETVGQRWIRSMKVFFGGDLFKAVSSVSGSKQKKIHLCKVIDSEFGMDIAIWHKGE